MVQAYVPAIANGIPVIWSTWESEPRKNKSYISDSGIVLVQSKIPENPGRGNLNLQATTTRRGLEYAQRRGYLYALKVRHDMEISNPGYLADELYDRANRTKLPSMLCVHTGHGNYFPDYIMFGTIEQLLDMWDIKAQDDKFAEMILTEKIMGEDRSFENMQNKVDFILPLLHFHSIEINWWKGNRPTGHPLEALTDRGVQVKLSNYTNDPWYRTC